MTYYVEPGASVNLGGGGGHVVVHAPGATIAGTPSTLLAVASLHKTASTFNDLRFPRLSR